MTLPVGEARLANLDLNLLVSLDALLAERSVSRAAARLGLSQPSLSASLARLRRHLRDDLLSRFTDQWVCIVAARPAGIRRAQQRSCSSCARGPGRRDPLGYQGLVAADLLGGLGDRPQVGQIFRRHAGRVEVVC